MRRNRKRDDLPNEELGNVRLESELILLSKRASETRSGRRRKPGNSPLAGATPETEPVTGVGTQLITQLADLDLNSDIRMSDVVHVHVWMPLWQVMELSMPGDFNGNLVDLLNASLDNRAGDPAYLARLNALILEAAQEGTEHGTV